MVPALDSQSGLFARLTPCLRGVSGVKKANMDARLEAPKSNGHDPETKHDPENKHDKERCMTETTNPIDDLNNAAAGMHGFDADTQNRPPQMSGGGIVLVIEDAARKTQLVIDDANAHALWIRSWRTDESRWRTWKLFSSMRQINKTVSARIADALEAAINGEVEDRRAAIVAAMEQEAAARQTAIDAALSSVQSGVTEDATRQMIEDRVDIESDARNDAINAAVNALASGRQSLIDAAVGVERAARETALADAARQRDDAIATAIATEVNDRDNAIAAAISGEVQQRTSAIAVETAARTSAISEALAGEARKRTSSITAAVATESDRRTADIEQIDRRVTASVAAVASGVRQDIETLSQRHSADVANLQGAIAAANATSVAQEERVRAVEELLNGRLGWVPELSLVSHGQRIVMRIHDWTGGQGQKPNTGYLGSNGLVAGIAGAVNLRGAQGVRGSRGPQGPQGPEGHIGSHHHTYHGVASGPRPNEPTCVPGDTPVLMADGSWKPISDIRVGECIQGRTQENTVLAYDRLTLGNHRSPKLYSINGDYANTDDHLTLLDRGWAVLEHKSYEAYCGQVLGCVYLGDMTPVSIRFDGIAPADVSEYRVGDRIAFGKAEFRTIESIEPIDADPDQTIYSLVADGDGTMQVAGGYVLSAWVNDEKWLARANR